MALYAFELGRLRPLSIAELNAVIGEENHIETIENFAIFELSEKKTDIWTLQERLGGTIKIAKILDTLEISAPKIMDKDIEDSLKKILNQEFKDQSGTKIPFAISVISLHGDPKVFLKNFLNFSKKIIKSFGLNCRFVNKPWMNPTPAQVYKSRSVEKGVDITIMRGKDEIYICRTISIQNIDAYSIRDYDKPFRDARMGMLPPKLAQIMLNLACGANTQTSRKATSSQTATPQIIFDPFVGSGTILMEALLQGKSALGSDIDEKAVEGTKKNIEWLKETFKNTTQETFQTSEVFLHDARTLTAKNLPQDQDFDAIVSETYLGLPVSRMIAPNERAKRFAEIARLHEEWLSNLKRILPTKKTFQALTIVITIPAFKIGPEQHDFFPNPKEFFSRLGFKVMNKKNLVYSRENQFIAREIIILKPTA